MYQLKLLELKNKVLESTPIVMTRQPVDGSLVVSSTINMAIYMLYTKQKKKI